ncbi:MAG: TIGR03621 family F420-dependent LLM class oxidoreductase [Acidimicrobiia bacterium]
MRPFRFGVQCATATSGRAWRDRARRIEALGYSTAFCPDHFGDQWAPTVAMTVAAEATTTLHVGALVYDVDYRHPVVLAKEAATLDLASEGRLELGIGAGWLRSDYEQAGIEYDPPGVRIARLGEAIDVCRALWSGEAVEHDGVHYQVRGMVGTPRPHRPGGPPVLVGGGGRKVLTLAARRADIVGLNASLHEGFVGAGVAESALPERFDERRRWVEEAAGPARFAELELQLNTFMVVVTATAAEADHLFDSLAGGFGLSPAQAREVPLVLAGTVEQLCEQLIARRERYGISYLVVPDTEAEAFAAVVERLAGR